MTPKSDVSPSILSKATAVKETKHEGDATSMIRSGFTLVSVAPQSDDDEYPFRYCLIWTQPLEETEYTIRELWQI